MTLFYLFTGSVRSGKNDLRGTEYHWTYGVPHPYSYSITYTVPKGTGESTVISKPYFRDKEIHYTIVA